MKHFVVIYLRIFFAKHLREGTCLQISTLESYFVPEQIFCDLWICKLSESLLLLEYRAHRASRTEHAKMVFIAWWNHAAHDFPVNRGSHTLPDVILFKIESFRFLVVNGTEEPTPILAGFARFGRFKPVRVYIVDSDWLLSVRSLIFLPVGRIVFFTHRTLTYRRPWPVLFKVDIFLGLSFLLWFACKYSHNYCAIILF